MIRLLISVAFAFAVATSAEAMSPAPLHEPDAMITQIRKARQARRCEDPNQIRINGICQYSPPMSPDPNTCVFGGMKAFALSTMGRSRLGEDLCPDKLLRRSRLTCVPVSYSRSSKIAVRPFR